MTTCEQTGPTPRPPGTYGGRGNEMLSQLGSNTVKVVLKRQGDTLLCRDRHLKDKDTSAVTIILLPVVQALLTPELCVLLVLVRWTGSVVWCFVFRT